MKTTISENICAYFTKQSRTVRFALLLMNSPIIFLSRYGFSLRKVTTSTGSKEVDSIWCSWRNWMPFLGFMLKCSVPVASNYYKVKKQHLTQLNSNSHKGYNTKCTHTHSKQLSVSISHSLFFIKFVLALHDQISSK